MDKKYQFQNITDKEIRAKGVQALANRPNAAQQYGQSGLTPEALKKWFDQLAELLAKRINELQNAIQSEEAAKYIGVALGKIEEFDGQYETLDDLILAMQTGHFAADILKLWPNENHSAFEPAALQDIIYGIAQSISDIEEDVQDLGDNKLAKVADAATYKRVYGVDDKGNQIMLNAAANPDAQVPLYSSNGALIAKMTNNPELNFGDYSGTTEVVTMAFMNEFSKHIGAGVEIVVNPADYTFYVNIYNRDGQFLGKSNTVDLPLEELVIDVTYDDNAKNVIVKLKNGEERKIPVAHFVNGLVTEAKHKADIDAVNNKIDAALNAYIVDVYDLVGGDYVDYS